MSGVGLLALFEHLAWFALLSFVCFSVYSGLRTESVKDAVLLGISRWIKFVLGVAILAALTTGLLSNQL